MRACADVADGVLASARGEDERARALLEDAVDGLERSGAPFEAARARIELATCLIALGRGAAAEREAAAALRAPRRAGGGARRRAVRGACSPRRAAATRRSRALTPREREVLRLLADGLTNRQIAARLVVSEHTVHRHVTNLLRKLDLPSRTAAAAHAARAGLLDSLAGVARPARARRPRKDGPSWRCRRRLRGLGSAP